MLRPKFFDFLPDCIVPLKVWDREKVVIIPDHYIFTSDERANRNVDILRDFCNEQDIKYFYDIKDLSNFKVCILIDLVVSNPREYCNMQISLDIEFLGLQ
jgi:homoaconitase/3-isopropylmalate dehydratase large subunit